MTHEKQLIILTTGKEDRGGRATIAFALAAISQSMGIQTTVYLTLGGAFWANDGSMNHVHVTGFDPLGDYYTRFMDAGGRVLKCPACTAFYCPADGQPQNDSPDDWAGLTTVATEALSSAVITF